MRIKHTPILVAVLVLANASFAHAQVFTKDLYFGIQGDSEVTQLQEFLATQNLYSGPITGNFFSLTLKAVKAFQSAQGISPAAGYFGSKTRVVANEMVGGEVNASNGQAISEIGNFPFASASSSIQLQLEALLKQVSLMQAQLQVQQSSTQAIQNLQQQVQQQTQTIQQQSQTLQQIQQSTQPTAVTVPTSCPSDKCPWISVGKIGVSSQLALASNPEDGYSISYGSVIWQKVLADSSFKFTISGRIAELKKTAVKEERCNCNESWFPVVNTPLTITYGDQSQTGITDGNGIVKLAFHAIGIPGTHKFVYSAQNHSLNDCGPTGICEGVVTESAVDPVE